MQEMNKKDQTNCKYTKPLKLHCSFSRSIVFELFNNSYIASSMELATRHIRYTTAKHTTLGTHKMYITITVSWWSVTL